MHSYIYIYIYIYMYIFIIVSWGAIPGSPVPVDSSMVYGRWPIDGAWSIHGPWPIINHPLSISHGHALAFLATHFIHFSKRYTAGMNFYPNFYTQINISFLFIKPNRHHLRLRSCAPAQSMHSYFIYHIMISLVFVAAFRCFWMGCWVVD